MFYAIEVIIEYWYVWVSGLLIFSFYDHFKHKSKAKERRVKRVEIIAAGGADPLPSNQEAKKLIFNLFLAVIPIFLIVLLVNYLK